VLAAGEYIQLVKLKLDEVAIGIEPGSEQRRYRLTPRRQAEISGLDSSVNGESTGFSPASETDTLGPYEIQDQIGQGGMANVYRAWDKDRKIFVAIKVLHPWLAADRLARERFRREIRQLEAFRHENIVRVYDGGEVKDRQFFAMELVEGTNLSVILASRGPLDWASSVGILLPIAKAAGYCHEHGLVRLDLKPSNILITNSGHVRLTDLGIAKEMRSTDERFTLSGQLVGTPIYMSPEQVRGTEIDPRSDVFSFGVVFYETVTGKVPFSGEEDSVVMRNILATQPARPSSLVAIPDAIASLIMRCIEKDPADRFQTMAEVVLELTTWLPQDSSESLAALVQESRHKSLLRTERQVTMDEELSPGGPSRLPAMFFSEMPNRGVTDTPKERARNNTLVESAPADISPQVDRSQPDLRPPFSTFPVPIPKSESPQVGSFPGATQSAGGNPPPQPSDISRAKPETPSTSLRLVYAESGETAWIGDSNKSEFTIGRVPGCDIELAGNSGASRYHARIVRRGTAVLLMDLNSLRGTYLNGNRILDQAPLSDNDVIRIGQIDLIFRDH
jgi:serine/threonine-protein kinase